MKKYIGTKTVLATPAVRKGGKVYLPSEEIPKSLEPQENGYKVVYKDGYESWSPKDVFEESYRLAETPSNQVDAEYHSHRDRIETILDFKRTEAYNKMRDMERAALDGLYGILSDYLGVLGCLYTSLEAGQGGLCGFGFGIAIHLLNEGYVLRRAGWSGKGLVVFKQVPTDIKADIIPCMQSLPAEAKKHIMASAKHIDYNCQCLIYNEQSGRADSWLPSSSDMFAQDWELVTNETACKDQDN